MDCECKPREMCECGCGCGKSFRRFYSSEEKRKCLESYSDELKKEIAAVEERLKESEK